MSSTIEKTLEYVHQQGWAAEIIVVDDGSVDDTCEIVRQYSRQHANVRLIQNDGNRGKGYTVRHGMLEASGDILIFSDADMSAPISEMCKLLAALAAGHDIAIGSRWLLADLQTQRQSLARQFLGRSYNVVLQMTLGLHFRDTQCGFKAFKRDAARIVFSQQLIDRWGFDAELLFLAKRYGLKVAEIPVKWAHASGSKIDPISDGLRMLIDTAAIRWNCMANKYALPTTSIRLDANVAHRRD